MNFTKNFTFECFTRSLVAEASGFREQFVPSDDILDNIQSLCENLLQPISDALPGVMVVTSGYRCERLNKAVNGVDNSQHLVGMAADLQYHNRKMVDNQAIIDKVFELGLEFDQMIKEKGGQWVHLSYNKGKNRNQYLER